MSDEVISKINEIIDALKNPPSETGMIGIYLGKDANVRNLKIEENKFGSGVDPLKIDGVAENVRFIRNIVQGDEGKMQLLVTTLEELKSDLQNKETNKSK